MGAESERTLLPEQGSFILECALFFWNAACPYSICVLMWRGRFQVQQGGIVGMARRAAQEEERKQQEVIAEVRLLGPCVCQSCTASWGNALAWCAASCGNALTWGKWQQMRMCADCVSTLGCEPAAWQEVLELAAAGSN